MNNVKIPKNVKDALIKSNNDIARVILGENYESILQDCAEGFLFHYDNWDCELLDEVEECPYAQYALIDILFKNYVNYIEENDGDWTQEEANNQQLIDECFHEYLRELTFFRFKNKKITTQWEARKEFEKINFFPPRMVIKDRVICDIA